MADDELPDDVSEADALDQRRAVDDQSVGDEVLDDDSFEVPEADALDQARAVPTDDEPDPEG